MKKRRVFIDVLIYVLLAVLSLIWIAPIVWLILQSFGGDIGPTSSTLLIPKKLTFDNYIMLFTNQYRPNHNILEAAVSSAPKFSYLKSVGNTFIIAVFSTVISTILTLSTSFAFSRLRFKGRQGMMKFILTLGMFPGFLSMILLYQIFKLVSPGGEITGTSGLVALILCYTGGAGMGYYISKGFFDTISKSIDEAAMLDGANRLQIFVKITIPLAKPIIVYTILTAFMAPWCEFILASYLLPTGNENNGSWTVAVTLFKMLDRSTPDFNNFYNQFCAGSVLIALPITLLFIFMQKYYVGGVTGGAVKG